MLALEWFIEYDLGQDLKVNNKGFWALSYDSLLQFCQYHGNGLNDCYDNFLLHIISYIELRNSEL